MFNRKMQSMLASAFDTEIGNRNPELYRKDGEKKWVTIGGTPDGDKKHAGGTPVQLDGKGEITKGPDSIEGKDIDDLDQNKGDNFELKAPKNKEDVTKHKQDPLFDKGHPSEAEPVARPGKIGGIDAPSIQTLPDGRKVGVTMLTAGEMAADPARFQYKVKGIDYATGTNEELKEVKRFRPEFAGQLLMWHDPKDGQTYVINGHHRYELATRSGYEGHIPAFLIDAKDEKEARAIGALANIAEGRGASLDAAKFFRESNTSPEKLKEEGISLKGKTADEGVQLAKLSDRAFADMVNGRLSEKRGLAVARHLDDHELQNDLFHQIALSEQKGMTVRDDDRRRDGSRDGPGSRGDRRADRHVRH